MNLFFQRLSVTYLINNSFNLSIAVYYLSIKKLQLTIKPNTKLDELELVHFKNYKLEFDLIHI